LKDKIRRKKSILKKDPKPKIAIKKMKTKLDTIKK
jgi:hypothetical protein